MEIIMGIMEIFADTISKGFEIITSSPLLSIIIITTISIYIFKSMANAVIGNYPSSEPESITEIKEVPKQQIEVKIKSIKEEPQLVICNYCGTKHKAEDKICSTCNAVLPTEKE